MHKPPMSFGSILRIGKFSPTWLALQLALLLAAIFYCSNINQSNDCYGRAFGTFGRLGLQQPNHTTTPTTAPTPILSTPTLISNTIQHHQFPTTPTAIFNTNNNTNFQHPHSTTTTTLNNTNTQHLRLHSPSFPTLENIIFLNFQFWRLYRVGRNMFLPRVKLQISAQIYFTGLLRLLGIHNCRFY